jgi:hypothetical protein
MEITLIFTQSPSGTDILFYFHPSLYQLSISAAFVDPKHYASAAKWRTSFLPPFSGNSSEYRFKALRVLTWRILILLAVKDNQPRQESPKEGRRHCRS